MDTLHIPNTAIETATIAYGCMGLGGGWDSSPLNANDIAAARNVIEATLSSGINLFDHADIYRQGKSEQCFGAILKDEPKLRNKMILQSKCGIRMPGTPESQAPARYDFSYQHIVASVEQSLQRLNTDYLDILLLHRPDPLMQPEEVARAFSDLKKDGKVCYFGVSNHCRAQIELLQHSLDVPLCINQIQLSLLHHYLLTEGVDWNSSVAGSAAADDTVSFCHRSGILLQSWGSLDGGLLTGRAIPDDMKHLQPVVDMVAEIAAIKQVSPEAVALSWLLRHPAGIQPLIGTTHPGRIQACAQASASLLEREQWYRLTSAVRGRDVP